MTATWHWFIAGITIASLIGCLWLLVANARGKPGESTTGHVWDDDLREYNNPLPRWWLNLFLLTVAFAAGYLALYPGLGDYAGRRGWTQEKQLQERLATVQAKRQAVYAALGERDIPSLAKDEAVLALGRDLFLSNCAGCHGADALGARGFPNLADRDWLYGGTPEAIVTSITEGRHGSMPPFSALLDPTRADDLIDTVRHWSDPAFSAQRREQAMQTFRVSCAACHGADGKGNTQIGAPDLTDRTWLHGSSRERIRETILFGRNSRMPAHRELLSADEIRVVSSYVYSLSPEAP